MRAAKTEASTAATVRGFGDQEYQVRRDCASAAQSTATEVVTSDSRSPSSVSTTSDQERKAFATLQAAAALRGFRLDLIETDVGAPAFVITRWALTKQLASLDDVSTFLQRVGGSDAR